ncbi:MAG: cobalamin-independent methionine synthase II family protein [Conexivisphaerales archaeon]
MFTTSVVGSFPRPRFLIEAFDKFGRKEISKEEYEEAVQDAIKLTVKEEELAGLDVITDGEMRRSSFVSFVGQKLPGFKLVHITELKKDAKEIMKREKAQLTLWRAVAEGRLGDAVLAEDELRFTKSITSKDVKITLPSPYLVMWETWHKGISDRYYKEPEDLAEDYAKILRKEVLRLKEGGAAFIQLDEPMLGDLVEASQDKPDRYRKVVELIHGQKYRGFKEEVKLACSLVNQVVKGIAGVRLGVHLDRWPNKDSPFYNTGYEKLFPELLELKVKQFVLEYASPGAGDPSKVAAELPSDIEMGLGVVKVRDNTVEDPKQIAEMAEKVAKIIGGERVWLNPDCGFAPGMYRGFPRAVAFAKIRAMVKAAEMLRKKHS